MPFNHTSLLMLNYHTTVLSLYMAHKNTLKISSHVCMEQFKKKKKHRLTVTNWKLGRLATITCSMYTKKRVNKI